MCKKIMRRLAAMTTAVILAAAMTGCGVVDWIKPSSDSEADTSASTAKTTTDRKIETTKTATYVAGASDDLDLTSMTTVTGEKLDSEYDIPEYDPEVRKTMSKTSTTTLYTLPSGITTQNKHTTKQQSFKVTTSTTTKSSTTKVTTTAFNADSLFAPTDDMKYASGTQYTVASDTTYLNLRFGPSKDYSVQLEIPNGKAVTATAETTDKSGQKWVYTSYNGTAGWVMADLLK